ncbi:MAG: YqzL family protein [Caulobacteraceae bacterium]
MLNAGFLWPLFQATGSIKAYLLYKKLILQ